MNFLSFLAKQRKIMCWFFGLGLFGLHGLIFLGNLVHLEASRSFSSLCLDQFLLLLQRLTLRTKLIMSLKEIGPNQGNWTFWKQRAFTTLERVCRDGLYHHSKPKMILHLSIESHLVGNAYVSMNCTAYS